MMREASRGWLIAFAAIALAALLLVVAPGRAQNAPNPATALGDAIAKAANAYAAVAAYDAEVWTQERVGGKLRAEEHVHTVFVKSPMKIYCRWLPGGAYEGLQTSYVAARDGANSYMALESGAAGLIGARTYPNGSKILHRLYPHQYPLKQYHMGFLFSRLQTRQRRAAELNMVAVSVQEPIDTLIPGRRIRLFTCDFAANFPADPVDGVVYRRMIIGFDEKISLPLFIETSIADNKLYARYKYVKFTANPSVPDSLFQLTR
jgi:hypothetical protein